MAKRKIGEVLYPGDSIVLEVGDEKREIVFVDPPPSGATCGNCWFYKNVREKVGEGEFRDVPYGFCVRFPPAASSDRKEFGFWPKVLQDHWCGEHKDLNGDSGGNESSLDDT